MNRTLPVVALVALLAAGCDVKVGEGGLSVDIVEGKATDEWVRSYTLAPGGELSIVNVNGAIEASAAEGSQVEVRAFREARAGSDADARALLDKLEIAEDVSPELVSIESKMPTPGSGLFGRSRVTVRYVVRLPAGLAAKLATENGGIRLDGVDGAVHASTTNGGITGRDLSGAMSAAAVNGGVQLALTSVTGDVSVTSVNGGVRLELPRDVKGQLDATTVNGGVTVDESLPFVASEQGRRRVAGTLNGGGPKITAGTTNGGVRISMLGGRDGADRAPERQSIEGAARVP